MNFDIQTGSINLTASGENVFIIRKGKKIKIPSVEVQAKLLEEFQKTKDNSKIIVYQKGQPKLEDGDSIVCGIKSIAKISVNYNEGKEKPIDDWKSGVSKTVGMGPNSELLVSGFEVWDETDKDKKRHHGESIKNIELKKGFFSVSYSNTEDALITPTAFVKFLGDGGASGSFDVYEDILYSNAAGEKGVEYTNRQTKSSFIAKSNTGMEIIVTRDGIYKKGILKMDDIFNSFNTLGVLNFLQVKIASKMIPAMDEKAVTESYTNLPKTMEQALGAFEMYSKMAPEDLERMMKIGEAHGAKITPEVMKQMKEIPEAMKMMEKSGFAEQLKKATAMGKGMIEGLGNQGMERLVKMQAKGMKQAKEMMEKPAKVFIAEGGDLELESILESPRKYKPLADAKKVA